jgi:hypothetical protein
MIVPRRVDHRMRAVEARVGHPDRLAVLAVEDAQQPGGVLADAHRYVLPVALVQREVAQSNRYG